MKLEHWLFLHIVDKTSLHVNLCLYPGLYPAYTGYTTLAGWVGLGACPLALDLVLSSLLGLLLLVTEAAEAILSKVRLIFSAKLFFVLEGV